MSDNKIHLTETQFLALIIISLSFLILVVYWPVQNYEFINYDDPLYVSENFRIQNGITFKSIRNTFNDFHTGHWHPLTMLSHMMDWQLFGDRAGGHHWTNVTIHIFNIILLFLLLRNLTGAIWRSAFVAALFALHPINVESVAWIAERKNILSTFFWLLTMFFYVWYVKKPNWKRYLPVFISFALGLMSKPMLVTLPFVLLLVDYWPLNRFEMNLQSENQLKINPVILKNDKIFFLIVEKIPLFILSVISCYLTIFASIYVNDIPSFESFTLLKRIFNTVVSYSLYIKKMFWPIDLAIFYPLSDISILQFFIALLFLVSVTVLICKYFRKYPYLFVGWFWYLGTLIPVIGLIQVGAQAMADRYAYVPLIGIFIMIAWFIPDTLLKVPYKKWIIIIISLIIITSLFILTMFQIQKWRNSYIVFQQALNVTNNNYLAHSGIGIEFSKHGDISETFFHLYESLRLKDSDRTRNYLGYVLMNQGRIVEAETEFRKSIKKNPQNVNALNNLGVALAKQGKFNEAIIEFSKAMQIDPFYERAKNNLDSAKKELYNEKVHQNN